MEKDCLSWAISTPRVQGYGQQQGPVWVFIREESLQAAAMVLVGGVVSAAIWPLWNLWGSQALLVELSSGETTAFNSVPISQQVMEGGETCGPLAPRTVGEAASWVQGTRSLHPLQGLSDLGKVTLLGEGGEQFAFDVPPLSFLSPASYLKISPCRLPFTDQMALQAQKFLASIWQHKHRGVIGDGWMDN